MIPLLFPFAAVCGVCAITNCVIVGWKKLSSPHRGAHVWVLYEMLHPPLTGNQDSGGFSNMKQTQDCPHFILRMSPVAAPSNSPGAVLLVLIQDVISG